MLFGDVRAEVANPTAVITCQTKVLAGLSLEALVKSEEHYL